MTLIYDTYQKYYERLEEQRTKEYLANRPSGKYVPKLWATDLNKSCPRETMLRIQGNKGESDFSPVGLDMMHTGVIIEDDTAKALRWEFGDSLIEQLRLSDEYWSGKPDFVLFHKSESPIIIEHKATSDSNWKDGVSENIPRHPHIAQTLLYGYLYEKEFGIKPKLILMYKAFGLIAEYELSIEGTEVFITGTVNNARINTFKVDYDFHKNRIELEELYKNNILPPKLEKQWQGCTFMGKPSCKFYNLCW